MQLQTIDFNNVVKDIETYKIVLPDFQREFVWRDENMQKQIVASVFAKMPIGSILLLESSPEEFASKNIGSKKETDHSKLEREVKFLLDGQQRITVLTNVFSNIIFEQCSKLTDLISPSLKRRFFLSLPKWKYLYNNPDVNDILGIRNFSDPQNEYDNIFFLTNEILPYIEIKPFQADDSEPFNSKHPIDSDLDSYCVNTLDNYLIPLYVFIPTSKNAQQTSVRRRNIIDKIGSKIEDEILDFVLDSTSKNIDEKRTMLTNFMNEDDAAEVIEALNNDEVKVENLLKDKLSEKRICWTEALRNYINSCLNKMSLNEIVVTAEQRARAIDIYENLNRGGISLSTFDLIMARVAIVSKDNFYKRIVNNINIKRNYDENLLPSSIRKFYNQRFPGDSYNAAVNTSCYSNENNKIEKMYIDAFLDVLSLYCNNKTYKYDGYNIDYIKRNKILQLSPEEINLNCEKICTSLDRALFFFQVRCGIRNIREINYSLMLVFVATIFTNDSYYNNLEVHEKLEAWYWASVFSGEFDKDQSSVLIKHLKLFFGMLSKQCNDDWIKSMREEVLNNNNFSDEKLLLLDKVAEDRFPKKILRTYISQYFLSKTYNSMFDAEQYVSVFSDNVDSLELHHIIPLGSVANIQDSAKKLRDDKKHICNSPLNFVYITKDDNIKISCKSIDEYSKMINDNVKASLQISEYNSGYDISSPDKVKSLLKIRYNYLKGDIKNHITELL